MKEKRMSENEREMVFCIGPVGVSLGVSVEQLFGFY
jgi:hypothetical protein